MKNLIFVTFIFCNTAIAILPQYNTPEILARSDIYDGYNLPKMSFITNVSPVINDSGDVAFKVEAIGDKNAQGIWAKRSDAAQGKIIFTAPDDRFITDPSINNSGKIAFSLFDEGITDGIFVLDSKTLTVSNVLPSTGLNLQNFTYPVITDNNDIFFRGTTQEGNRSFFLFNSSLKTIISEGDGASYLFKPSINNSGYIASKIRLGEIGQWDESNPDQIILIGPDHNQIIAQDQNNNPESSFLSFDNSVALSDNGLIAFVGLAKNNKRGVFVYNKGFIVSIATEGENNVSEIEKFSVKVNDKGMVLFRAKDSEGKRSIFVGEFGELQRLIGEGDTIESDLGPSKILFDKSSPGFGGEIDMNAHGDIVFNSIILNADGNEEYGQAIYKISTKK